MPLHPTTPETRRALLGTGAPQDKGTEARRSGAAAERTQRRVAGRPSARSGEWLPRHVIVTIAQVVRRPSRLLLCGHRHGECLVVAESRRTNVNGPSRSGRGWRRARRAAGFRIREGPRSPLPSGGRTGTGTFRSAGGRAGRRHTDHLGRHPGLACSIARSRLAMARPLEAVRTCRWRRPLTRGELRAVSAREMRPPRGRPAGVRSRIRRAACAPPSRRLARGGYLAVRSGDARPRSSVPDLPDALGARREARASNSSSSRTRRARSRRRQLANNDRGKRRPRSSGRPPPAPTTTRDLQFNSQSLASR